MDLKPLHQQPASGDDELAKVLAGMGGEDGSKHQQSPLQVAGLQFEETPSPAAPPAPPVAVDPPAAAAPAPEPPQQPEEPPKPAPVSIPEPTLTAPPLAPTAATPLDALKKAALEELRPLATKLDLPPEEKFTTLLLIIRSTDDQSLLTPAHEAAKSINDEQKRAQALLDIIKEIDYFSNPKASA